jgi:hypothetical protein
MVSYFGSDFIHLSFYFFISSKESLVTKLAGLREKWWEERKLRKPINKL